MNNIKNIIKEKLPDIFIYLLLLLVICLIMFFSQNNGVFYDDFMACSYGLDERIFDSLMQGVSVHGGGYTSLFLTKLTTFGIPYLLNMHPGDYLCSIAPVIKGILYALFFFSAAKCVLIRNHSKWLFLTLLMFLIFSLLYILHLENLMCIKDNITFFRYVFPSMFYFILFSYVYKTIIFRNFKFNFLYIPLITFSVLVAATNLETIIFPFCLFFCLIIGYNLLIDFISLYKKSKVFKKNYKYHLNIKFYAPVVLFYIMAFLYIKSPRFYGTFAGRGFFSSVVSLQDIGEFFNLFYQMYIVENILYWFVLIGIILVYIYKQKSVLQKKKLLCSLFMIISVVCVYLSLIVFGKNGYDGDYWISDIKLWIFFKVLVFAPAFILLDDILKHISIKYKKISINLVCLFLFIASLYYAVMMYNNRHLVSSVYTFKKINYINEKMYRFFSLKNETPYLLKINPNPHDYDWVPLLFLELLDGNHDYQNKQEICSFEETRTSVYLEKVYNVRFSDEGKSARFCLSDDAVDKFSNLGGTISRSELNNIKFSKLKDSQYVLNNQIADDDRMTKNEIIDIFKSFYK